ncbi:MAG: thiamine pyrophosphate-dependent enzyme [Microgenomates group bacterium]
MANLETGLFPTWCPGCLLPGELIHSQNGINPIETIKIGDHVLTHTGKLQKVTEVYKHKYEAEIFHITTKCFGTVALTPEHPVLTVRRQHKKKHNADFQSDWVRAAQLKKGDYLVFPVPQETHDLKTIRLNRIKSSKDTRSRTLPVEILLNDDILFLFGLYIAEGWIHSREICFAFHLEETKLQQTVLKVFKKTFDLDGTIKRFPKKNLVELKFNHSVLARQFSTWFKNGAAQKSIPDFLLNLPANRQAHLIRGLWEGDGYVYKNSAKAAYKTISVSLTHQLKLLLIRQGIVPCISINKAYGIHKTSYSVQVSGYDDFLKLSRLLKLKTKFSQVVGTQRTIRNKTFIYLPISRIRTEKYTGPVYNLEVEKDNSFLGINGALHNCGDFGIWAALKAALKQLNLESHQFVMVYDIGCSGNMTNHLRAYAFHGLHGRAIPAAVGIKLANHSQKVIVIGGDGGLLSEGLTHFVSAARANMAITVILHNNQVYGLTTGQSSPTSLKGTKGRATPLGVVEQPLEPCGLALLSGATYVARAFAGNIPDTTKIFSDALTHQGFALVEVLQPCVTYNKLNTYDWFRQRVKPLPATPTNVYEAIAKAAWTETDIFTGVFKKDEIILPYHLNFEILKEKTLIQYQEKRDLTKYITSQK